MNERIKKYCIFVSHYIHKGVRTRLYATGIFDASLLAIYGSAPPCNSVIELLPLWCNATGKAEPFFISATNTFSLGTSAYPTFCPFCGESQKKIKNKNATHYLNS